MASQYPASNDREYDLEKKIVNNTALIADGGGGGGSGTVTSVSVTTANGVSGSVASATTTPAITLTLGAITPTTIVASSTISGTRLTSTVATGTAPLVVTSTTNVPNLYVARSTLSDSTTTNANLTGPVTSSGNATTITDAAVTLAKMADLAQDLFIGRTTASTGIPQTATITAAARTVLDDTSVGAMVDTIGGATATGTGGLVRITGSTLVAPTLGVASATSVNKVAITAPATSATLTVADGKTLTATETTTLNRQSSTGLPVEFFVACSDMTTAITATTNKAYFRAPYAFTVTEVRASLFTAQTAGSIFTVDINESGTTILSTKLTIDNNENTSTTAATPPVISDTAIADDASISIDVDQIGTSGASGLIVLIKGYR